MELLKELGSRSWINSSGKKDSKKFGLFLCPCCNKEVEKPISKGIPANSCGDKECRKSTFRANPLNKGNTKEIKISEKKFYSSIKERYRTVKTTYILPEKWKRYSNFFYDMIESYTNARKISDKVLFEVDDENEELSMNNCRWIPCIRYPEYPYSNNKNNRYVYIVKSGIYTKIGISRNISLRMTALQTGNPFPIQLVYAKEVDNAYNIEQDLHKKYSEFNISGEWFELSKDDINTIILYINSL